MHTEYGPPGDLIRRHRFRAGLSQLELARRAGVSIRAVRYIEQGRVARPRASSIRQLALALELSGAELDALLTGRSPDVPAPVRVDVLGPLRVRHGDRPVEIDSAMVRTLLGLLAVQPGRVVGAGEIVEVLWQDRPPRTAPQLIHTYVGQLRRLLEPDRGPGARALTVVRSRGGYRLDLPPAQLDLVGFDELTACAAQEPDPATRYERYRQAVAAWRGPVLADTGDRLREHPAVVAAGHRRIAAVLAYAEVGLALGRCAAVVDPLRALTADEPLHEQLAARLMAVLAAAGQQAAALALYREIRDRLDAELGVEPGPQLRDAHLRVLRGGAPAAPGRDDAVPAAAGRDETTPATAGPAPTGRPPVPAQLPADVTAFTGRAADLQRLDRTADEAGAVVVISTIAGMGGVGKTALAVHWAHRVCDRFPDGQLYVDLRGHDSAPALRPLDALAGFLRALDVPADEVPADLDRAAALYRSRLAGRRMLVLLDNAGSAAQVRPLLPASPGCLVLVTSRHRLGTLVARDGARPLILDVLAPDEALALVTRIVGVDRVGAEPAAAAELVTLCARLPLALRIAAANLAVRPRQRIGHHVDRLRAGNRLAGLAVEDDPETAVRAAFELSYRALPASERRLFRLLGLLPGVDPTAATAAALGAAGSGTGGSGDAGRPVDEDACAEAEAMLERLAARHLIDEHAAGRYAMHDLLRLYAAELAAAEDAVTDRRAAVARLAGHYRRTVAAAAGLLYPHLLHLPEPDRPAAPDGPVEPGPERFAAGAAALDWLDAERANLVATVTHLCGHGHDRAGWLLADVLQGYFRLRMNAVDWATVATAARRAADAAGDPYAQADARLNLGCLYDFQSRFDEAADEYRAGLEYARRAGWTDCAAVLLNNAARIQWLAGRPEQTIDQLTAALALHEEAHRRAGQAVTLANLGAAYWELARDERPARGAGRFDRAIGCLHDALVIHRDIGDRRNEADTLRVLAGVHRDAGDHGRALELAEQALALSRDAGDRRSEAYAHTTRATVHAGLGRDRAALAGHHEALRIAREAGDQQLEAQVLTDLAETELVLGRRTDAAGHAAHARAIGDRIGHRLLGRRAGAVLARAQVPRPALARAG